MKKTGAYYFLILITIQSLTSFLSCKTVSKVEKLSITARGSVEHPVKIGLGSFFPFGSKFNFIDTSNSKVSYHFIPGELLSINNDTTIRLFYQDSITVDYRSGKPVIYSSNTKNTTYNLFYYDLSSTLAPIYRSNLNFFWGKEESIISDENYIDNYLSKSDSLLRQEVNTLCSKYPFSQATSTEILRNVLEAQKLADSYFYFRGCIQKLDSLGTLQARLHYYRDKVDNQHVSAFSQKGITLLVTELAYQFMQISIRKLQNRDQLEKYYSDVQHFFTKGSICYDYLVSSLEIQAKKNQIRLRGFALKALKRDSKKSIFKKYVEAKYNRDSEDLKDSPSDMNLYDVHFKSIDLTKVISRFEDKPLLIDFWASWCSPCLKKIPETIAFKNKYPNLNIIFISLDKSQDAWKLYLYEHSLLNYSQFRRNFNNQDRIFNQIPEIPKYGLLYKNGHVELFDELSDSLIKEYCEKF